MFIYFLFLVYFYIFVDHYPRVKLVPIFFMFICFLFLVYFYIFVDPYRRFKLVPVQTVGVRSINL
jgi:hypothetical protein